MHSIRFATVAVCLAAAGCAQAVRPVTSPAEPPRDALIGLLVETRPTAFMKRFAKMADRQGDRTPPPSTTLAGRR
jgi:hypothetical protein